MRGDRLGISIALLAALAMFVPGINWGLPSRAVDPYLFGGREPWSGQKIASLMPAGPGMRGADVDANPIVLQSGPTLLNRDDRQRAELIVRYRLYSHQPDEMITFRSLARIKDFRGDPRLYQYGGLWIYPVGAMLQAANVVGLIEVRGDPAFYYDRPEAFGRFYVVARAYTVMWGVVATAAVFLIVRRVTGTALIATAGAIAFAAMPVVVTMAHEAKPHLPGLALTLLAVLAGVRYLDTGRMKWAALAGMLCGAAFGMVLSGLLAFAVLPMMVMLRPGQFRERFVTLMQATFIGMITYIALNPYVLINALTNREMLRSNLGNSTDMYRVGLGGFGNALRLIVEGASPIVLIGGVLYLAVSLATCVRRRRYVEDVPGRGDLALLLLAPALLVTVQFVLLADGKPPEYARFGLLPDTFLLVATFAGIAMLKSARPRAILAIATMVMVLAFGIPYVSAFVRDSRAVTSRLRAAEEIRGVNAQVALTTDPAPYSAPPADLFARPVVLVPRGTRVAIDAAQWVLVEVDHSRSPAPISWSDTRFRVVHARGTGATTVSSP